MTEELSTSAVHDFSHVGGGHDFVAAEEICQLAPDWHNDGHDHVGHCREETHLHGGQEDCRLRPWAYLALFWGAGAPPKVSLAPQKNVSYFYSKFVNFFS